MKFRRVILSLAAGTLALLCLPSVAAAAALVDESGVADQIPSAAKAYFAEREAEFQRWLVGRSGSRAVSRILDAPYRILNTTSHQQIRNDYCVPATTTIIDHFLRGADAHWTQNQWAAYTYNGSPLWTDAYGGNMWVMAMGLKAGTGARLHVLERQHRPLHLRPHGVRDQVRRAGRSATACGSTRDSGPTTGSITWVTSSAARGFDWRQNLIYVDDPYPENAAPPLGYGSAGGATYGQKTYERGVVAGGVLASASQQVVY